jgi:DNA-binding NarL/FixJ family response regulator
MSFPGNLDNQPNEPAAMTLRVALIDDHEPFRHRLRALLETNPDIEIVAEAGSGHELLEIAPTTEMDAACMDISMPGMNGIEATRRLLAIKPKVRVIGLSAYAEQHYVDAMMDAGAVGYFTKGDVGDELLEAIGRATRERPYFGPGISFAAASNADAKAAPGKTLPDADLMLLGAMELEILRQVAKGSASSQIAHDLSVDSAMVDVYRRNIVRKLHLANEAELVEYALRNCAGAS